MFRPMAFQEFPAGKVDGLAIYPKAPEVLNQADRGTLLGQRRDTLIYIGTRPGRFVIPAATADLVGPGGEGASEKRFPERASWIRR